MDDDATAILYGLTLLAVVILGSLGHEQLALALATGALLPSPVVHAIDKFQGRNDSN